MRPPLLIILLVPLAACTLGTKKQAATPPPPHPPAVQAPVQEAQLSIPQTSVTLPGEQKFNPDAIPKVPAQVAPPEKTEAAPAPRVSRRIPAGPQRPDPETETEAPAPPAVPAKAPLQPMLGDEEQRNYKVAIEKRKKEIADRVRLAKGRLSEHDKSIEQRIDSFLAQCEEAEKRGDYSQADSLSERAAVLARDLPE